MTNVPRQGLWHARALWSALRPALSEAAALNEAMFSYSDLAIKHTGDTAVSDTHRRGVTEPQRGSEQATWQLVPRVALTCHGSSDQSFLDDGPLLRG